jgi:hypothetical protein
MQMIDVHQPTSDGRTVLLSRYTDPDTDTALLLQKLQIPLPDQPSLQVLSAQKTIVK